MPYLRKKSSTGQPNTRSTARHRHGGGMHRRRGHRGALLAAPLAAAALVAGGVQLDSAPAAARSGSATATVERAPATSAVTTAGDVQPTFPIRAAFYYPWFPEAWNQNGYNPYTNYTPSRGFYDGSKAWVLDHQIADMQYAGMEAGIASWWGQGSRTDQRVPLLLQAAAGTSFRWSLYYEAEAYGNPTVTQLSADLDYIGTHYGSDPSYLRVGGKPVIFVYADGSDGCAMADRWKQANAGRFYVVLKVFSGYTTCASQPSGWHQYAPSAAKDAQGQYSYSVSPGFWKKGEATPRLARSPSTFATNVAAMAASGARFQLVTTYNEWGEGTAVESATQWASVSKRGTYLDILHRKLGSAPAPSPTTTSPAPTTTSPAPTTSSTGRVSKLLVIVEENHSQTEAYLGMPYLASLADTYAKATNYYAVTHPSEGNYIAMIAGKSETCGRSDPSPSTCPQSGNTVFGEAVAKGVGAKTYAQTMPSNCATSGYGAYAPKHNPWVYFPAEATQCKAYDVPAGTPSSGALASDIAGGRLPAVSMLVPDLLNDAHDGTLLQADAYLKSWIPKIMAGPDYQAGRLAIVVTFDEDDNSAGNNVNFALISPSQHGRVVTTRYDHYSLCRLIADIAGVTPLGAAATAADMRAAFGI